MIKSNSTPDKPFLRYFSLFSPLLLILFFLLSFYSGLVSEEKSKGKLKDIFSVDRTEFGFSLETGFIYFLSPNSNFKPYINDGISFSKNTTDAYSHYFSIPLSILFYYWKSFIFYENEFYSDLRPFSKILTGLRWGKEKFIKRIQIGIGLRNAGTTGYGYIITGFSGDLLLKKIKVIKLKLIFEVNLFPFSFNIPSNPFISTDTVDNLIYAFGAEYKLGIGFQFWGRGPYIHIFLAGYGFVPIIGTRTGNKIENIQAYDLILEQKLMFTAGYRFHLIIEKNKIVKDFNFKKRRKGDDDS
ncbi:MAG: hypothetical protein KAS39_02635, partial [Actinomycetia bacterium]|nr:hypothetical protein [Actinomycetes bacterium]